MTTSQELIAGQVGTLLHKLEHREKTYNYVYFLCFTYTRKIFKAHFEA